MTDKLHNSILRIAQTRSKRGELCWVLDPDVGYVVYFPSSQVWRCLGTDFGTVVGLSQDSLCAPYLTKMAIRQWLSRP